MDRAVVAEDELTVFPLGRREAERVRSLPLFNFGPALGAQLKLDLAALLAPRVVLDVGDVGHRERDDPSLLHEHFGVAGGGVHLHGHIEVHGIREGVGLVTHERRPSSEVLLDDLFQYVVHRPGHHSSCSIARGRNA